ncbi:SusC/RagA family TonB-linked outer membrane protein [Carboxylicivirga sp. N1Y90]|uniref:SusC/RagA family TonB-linked outer membrane protein n=1 Tax=Carboxylicivirga fragile TaxID=3417571 RepID=UPI003D32747F|nr:TonB-dependent receptor [Marinilabiliaceae bacterium N1Y90]
MKKDQSSSKLNSLLEKGWLGKRLMILAVFCIFGLHGHVFAQETKTITGTVTSSEGETLPGVNVFEKGTTNGTVTDFDGKFSLQVSDDATLVVSFIGFTTQEILVDGKSNFDVILQADMTDLDEVVVVGYGIQKKSDVTGAISTVKPEELVKRDVASVDQALQGQMAGVTVTQGSGTPGESPNITIRGLGSLNNTSPLYVVDGMMLDDIAHINAKDIESLQVLKDASASAIYGSRGANGVIIVTTKKGQAGQGKVMFSGYYGIQNFGHTPELTNASEWAMLNNEARLAAGMEPNFSNPASLGEGTDWLGAITNENAPIQSYDLSFSGGTEKSTYFISGSYFNQEGVINKSDYDRLSVRINSEHRVKEWLTVGENVTVTTSNQSTILEGDEWNNLLITPLNMEPTTPIFNEDGTYGVSGNQVNNPVAAIDNTFNNRESFRVLGNLYADIALMKGLVFKTNLGANMAFNEDNSYNPIYFVSITDQNEINSLSKGHDRETSLSWTNTLNYNTKFGADHDFAATVGTDYYDQTFEWDGLSVTDFPTDEEDYRIIDNSRNKNEAVSYGALFESRQISYLGRVNYAYKGRYLLTANFRADGSSKFGSKEKWGYFPSFSAGWRIIEEDFMDGVEFVSNLKLRAGWGQIGNQGAIFNYVQSTLASTGLNYVLGYPKSVVNGTAFQGVGNDEIKWETVETTNIGLDFGLLRGKLSGSFEYYIKDTRDMILDPPVPGQTGVELPPWQNTGAMKNTGIELALNWQDKVGIVEYSIGGNITTINNEVISLGTEGNVISNGDFRSAGFVNRTVVGRPISNFYGLVAEGLFQNQAEIDAYYANAGGAPSNVAPGDIRYRDADGDGEADYDFIGSPIADFTYAINGSLSVKGIDFSFLLNGVQGIDVYNGPDYYQLNSMAYWNTSKEMLNRWTGEGSTNNPRHPRLNASDSHNTRISSRYVEDASFLRIQNVQIGYTLPSSVVEKIKLESLRVYVSGQNLHTFTEYTGYDPEVGGYGTEIGLDRATYPTPRTITFGINLSF